jgi:hypothetical protein
MHDDDVSHVLFLICLYEGSFEGDILLGCGFMVVWGMKFYGFCCLLFVTTKKFKIYIYIYIYKLCKSGGGFNNRAKHSKSFNKSQIFRLASKRGGFHSNSLFVMYNRSL